MSDQSGSKTPPSNLSAHKDSNSSLNTENILDASAGEQGQARARAAAILAQLREQLQKIIIGQDQILDDLIVALLANGHVLIEGVPGLGKTLMVRALSKSFSGQASRIQFTPDLMPSDVMGHVLFDMQASEFRVRLGPVFTNLLLADEINRAPAKTQSALLEAMQERQVTIEGETHVLPVPFMVIATQNPLEHEGTYPLPEAELDRFTMKLLIDYPSHEDEVRLTVEMTKSVKGEPLGLSTLKPLVAAKDVSLLQALATKIVTDNHVIDYAVRLVSATRTHPGLLRGGGTRACLALVQTGRAEALMQGSEFVTPDHIKRRFLPVLRHRVALTADMEIEGVSVDALLLRIMEQTKAPRL